MAQEEQKQNQQQQQHDDDDEENEDDGARGVTQFQILCTWQVARSPGNPLISCAGGCRRCVGDSDVQLVGGEHEDLRVAAANLAGRQPVRAREGQSERRDGDCGETCPNDWLCEAQTLL